MSVTTCCSSVFTVIVMVWKMLSLFNCFFIYKLLDWPYVQFWTTLHVSNDINRPFFLITVTPRNLFVWWKWENIGYLIRYWMVLFFEYSSLIWKFHYSNTPSSCRVHVLHSFLLIVNHLSCWVADPGAQVCASQWWRARNDGKWQLYNLVKILAVMTNKYLQHLMNDMMGGSEPYHFPSNFWHPSSSNIKS